MIHSFHLNDEEEKRFQALVAKEKNKSESAIIRSRLFKRRERNQIKLEVVDLKFLSTISNIISSITDNYGRGNNIDEDLKELTQIVNNRLNQV